MLDNFLEIQIAEKIITETGDLIKKNINRYRCKKTF